MSLGSFFGERKPIRQELLSQISRPEHICLRDLLLIQEQNILLVAPHTELCEWLVQQAYIELKPIHRIGIFNFDFQEFLNLAQSPVDAEQIFEDFIEDVSLANEHVWLYLSNMDRLVSNHDVVASTLMYKLSHASRSGKCRVIATIDLNRVDTLVAEMPAHCDAFRKIYVPALAAEECLVLLQHRAEKLAKQFKVNTPVDVVERMQALVSRYVTKAKVYDKCNEVLRIAIARMHSVMRANHAEGMYLNLEHVAQVIADWEQIPVQHLLSGNSADALKACLKREVVGQDLAIKRIVELHSKKTPPIYIFAGPKYAGKTRVAKAMARFLNGSQRFLLCIDPSSVSDWRELYVTAPDYATTPMPLHHVVANFPNVVIAFKDFATHFDVVESFLLPIIRNRRIDPVTNVSYQKVTFVLMSALQANDGAAKAPPVQAPAYTNVDDLLSIVCAPEQEDVQHVEETADKFSVDHIEELLCDELWQHSEVVTFAGMNDETLRVIVKERLAEYVRQVKLDHGIEVMCQDEVLSFLVQQVSSDDMGRQSVDGIFAQYLEPCLDKALSQLSLADARQALHLMLNETGQWLVGQLVAPPPKPFSHDELPGSVAMQSESY